MPKNIVVFSDGTGQEGGMGNNTNVYKLFCMVENRTKAQITFYDRGLGTGWRKLSGSAVGAGISKNILECYEFIFDNYEAGDRVFLFGFSRGATTVRSLSSFIDLFGILPKSRPELIKHAYKIYQIRNKKRRNSKAAKFIAANYTMWCRIKFLGVWDTVAALGIPIKRISVFMNQIPGLDNAFQDLSLSPSVEHAYHALAIDDERRVFHPTPWHIYDEKGNSLLRDYQTVRQVWFCGAHTDVGGGYDEQNVSDIPLMWLTQKAVEHGLRIYPRHKVELNPDVNGVIHDPRGSRLTRLYRRAVRTWDPKTCGKLVIHESVLERTRSPHNQEDAPYAPWILEHEYEREPWIKEYPWERPAPASQITDKPTTDAFTREDATTEHQTTGASTTDESVKEEAAKEDAVLQETALHAETGEGYTEKAKEAIHPVNAEAHETEQQRAQALTVKRQPQGRRVRGMKYDKYYVWAKGGIHYKKYDKIERRRWKPRTG